MGKWPKFRNHDEFIMESPRLCERARRLSRLARRAGVEPDEVFGRIIGKLPRHWQNIPRYRGQSAYLRSVFNTCLADAIRADARRIIEIPPEKPWVQENLEQLTDKPSNRMESSEVFAVLNLALIELDAIDSLGTWILVLRDGCACKWKEIALAAGLCIPTCRHRRNRMREIFRARFPHLRCLLDDA